MGAGQKRKLSIPVKILYILIAITAVIHATAALFSSVADFINLNISPFFRSILANVTDIIPFSLAEALILLAPVIIFVIVRHALKSYADSWSSVLHYFISFIAYVGIFYILFFWVFGVGYNTPPLDEKLDLQREKVSAQELYDTALILIDELNEASLEVTFRSRNFSVMQYGISELSDKLNSDFENFLGSNGYISALRSDLKPVMLSRAMSYTHITGVYTYFTGEANLNTNFPDYTLPFTAAHEFAHQRGIAREDEANFVAFLVCKQSDDPYIRYCAYMNMLEYVFNALYSANADLYIKALNLMNGNSVYEMIAYGDFFEKYADSAASAVSGAVNDTYLKLNGTEGEISYGLVVELAVAYYKK